MALSFSASVQAADSCVEQLKSLFSRSNDDWEQIGTLPKFRKFSSLGDIKIIVADGSCRRCTFGFDREVDVRTLFLFFASISVGKFQGLVKSAFGAEAVLTPDGKDYSITPASDSLHSMYLKSEAKDGEIGQKVKLSSQKFENFTRKIFSDPQIFNSATGDSGDAYKRKFTEITDNLVNQVFKPEHAAKTLFYPGSEVNTKSDTFETTYDNNGRPEIIYNGNKQFEERAARYWGDRDMINQGLSKYVPRDANGELKWKTGYSHDHFVLPCDSADGSVKGMPEPKALAVAQAAEAFTLIQRVVSFLNDKKRPPKMNKYFVAGSTFEEGGEAARGIVRFTRDRDFKVTNDEVAERGHDIELRLSTGKDQVFGLMASLVTTPEDVKKLEHFEQTSLLYEKRDPRIGQISGALSYYATAAKKAGNSVLAGAFSELYAKADAIFKAGIYAPRAVTWDVSLFDSPEGMAILKALDTLVRNNSAFFEDPKTYVLGK